MKKVIAIVLLLAMALGLVACGGSGAGGSKGEEGLQIGFAKVNITPSFEVGLDGYGDTKTRKNTDGATDFIYVICIAAKEGEETVLLFTMDNVGLPTEHANEFREEITSAVGISGEKMYFSATHSHNAPVLDDAKYRTFASGKFAEAATKAIADLAPATILANKVNTEGLNFVRHYKMEDGSYAGSNFGDFSLGIVGHATEVDSEMQIVKFDRGADKKAVVMVNYQAHNDFSKKIGYNMISPGWVGIFRNELAAKSGCETAYFMGASGNVNASSKIESEAHGLDWKPYGEKLAQIAYEAMNDLKPVGGSGIVSTTYTMEAEVDHSWDHMTAQAQEVHDMRASAGVAAATAYGKTFGFSSAFQATAILRRAKMGPTSEVEQGAFRIHNIGFAVGPYEMFCENGRTVKNGGLDAGYEYVLIISGNSGYIPSAPSYEYGAYEAGHTTFAKGVAEKLQDKYVELLGGIK